MFKWNYCISPQITNTNVLFVIHPKCHGGTVVFEKIGSDPMPVSCDWVIGSCHQWDVFLKL